MSYGAGGRGRLFQARKTQPHTATQTALSTACVVQEAVKIHKLTINITAHLRGTDRVPELWRDKERWVWGSDVGRKLNSLDVQTLLQTLLPPSKARRACKDGQLPGALRALGKQLTSACQSASSHPLVGEKYSHILKRELLE